VPTEQQAADGLTKSLNREKFDSFKQQIGIVDCSEVIAAMERVV